MAYKRLFTSESVTEGHPDKVADQISDAILDALLAADPASRVAVETFAITGQIHLAGEVTTKTYIDIPKIVRETIKEIGYTKSAVGFDYETCGISVSIDEQSADIAMGVDKSLEAKSGKDDEFELTGHANGDKWKNIVVVYNPDSTKVSVKLPKGTWSIVATTGKIGSKTIGHASKKLSVASLTMEGLHQ